MPTGETKTNLGAMRNDQRAGALTKEETPRPRSLRLLCGRNGTVAAPFAPA